MITHPIDQKLRVQVFNYINLLKRVKYKTKGPLVPMKVARHFGIPYEQAAALVKEWHHENSHYQRETTNGN